MKKLLLFILFSLLGAMPATAREVLVVQGVRSSMYDDALRGFRGSCRADARVVVLSDYADPELARVIHEERPRLVVAVGDGALASLRKVSRTPVLSLMALGIAGHEAERPNLGGVSLFVKPEQYLYLFKKIKARRVGIVYDPAHTGWYVRSARAAARQCGVELVLREVSDPRQVLGQLRSLRGGVDALWVLPDATAVTKETLEAYFVFAQGQSLPVLSFSSAHLKLGALLALEADRVESGRQAGEMAQQFLSSGEAAGVPTVVPRRVTLRVNEAVARRFKCSSDLFGAANK